MAIKGTFLISLVLSIRSDKKSKSLGLGQGIIYLNNACCICKGNQVFGCLGYSEELWCIMDSILMEFLMDFIFMQGFWYFARSRTREIPKKREIPRNPPEIFPNTYRQNIFNTYLGY